MGEKRECDRCEKQVQVRKDRKLAVHAGNYAQRCAGSESPVPNPRSKRDASSPFSWLITY